MPINSTAKLYNNIFTVIVTSRLIHTKYDRDNDMNVAVLI